MQNVQCTVPRVSLAKVREQTVMQLIFYAEIQIGINLILDFISWHDVIST